MASSIITLAEVNDKINSGIYSDAKPCKYSKKSIDEEGELLFYGLCGEAKRPSSSRNIIKHFGGMIWYINSCNWGDVAYSLFVNEGHDFEIILPTHTSSITDNFAIAHEFCHYLLHSDLGNKKIMAKRTGRGKLEHEANWFAMSFLMPYKSIKKMKLHNKPEEVSTYFQVPLEVARIRCNDIAERESNNGTV